MATNPRKTPNDAALSAVEEALRLDFGARIADWLKIVKILSYTEFALLHRYPEERDLPKSEAIANS